MPRLTNKKRTSKKSKPISQAKELIGIEYEKEDGVINIKNMQCTFKLKDVTEPMIGGGIMYETEDSPIDIDEDFINDIFDEPNKENHNEPNKEKHNETNKEEVIEQDNDEEFNVSLSNIYRIEDQELYIDGQIQELINKKVFLQKKRVQMENELSKLSEFKTNRNQFVFEFVFRNKFDYNRAFSYVKTMINCIAPRVVIKETKCIANFIWIKTKESIIIDFPRRVVRPQKDFDSFVIIQHRTGCFWDDIK